MLQQTIFQDLFEGPISSLVPGIATLYKDVPSGNRVVPPLFPSHY